MTGLPGTPITRGAPNPFPNRPNFVSKPWNPLPHMDDYLEELGTEEKAPSYIRMVKLGLRFFSDYLREQGITHPEEVTRMHIVRFQGALGEMVNPETQEAYALSYRSKIMAYVKGWFTWMEEAEILEESPWVRIRVPRVPKKSKPLENDDVVSLFETHRKQAFTMDPFDFHEREVVLVLLYSWGLRAHELCSLNLSQMDLAAEAVKVRNKGGTQKVLPYGEVEKTAISRWVRHRARYANRDEDALLVTRQGVRMNPKRVWTIITNLGNRAGVDVNPHRFRDTLGTKLLDNDVPVEIIMKILGHTTRSQTMAYARLNDPVIARAHGAVIQGDLGGLLHYKTTGG